MKTAILTLLFVLLTLGSARAQKDQPLVMDSFKDGVYTLHAGKITIKARCARTELVGTDIDKSVPGKCSDQHGVFEVPGDKVPAYGQTKENTQGVARNSTSYEIFPAGDLDISATYSWDCIEGYQTCASFHMLIYHFKILEMRQANAGGKK